MSLGVVDEESTAICWYGRCKLDPGVKPMDLLLDQTVRERPVGVLAPISVRYALGNAGYRKHFAPPARWQLTGLRLATDRGAP